jgi:hypothetical protein
MAGRKLQKAQQPPVAERFKGKYKGLLVYVYPPFGKSEEHTDLVIKNYA